MRGPHLWRIVDRRRCGANGIEGAQVSVFNAAKTVADCFKYRNKIGVDVALEALRDGWQQGKLPMDALYHYATVNRVANVMRPYLESVTA